MKNSVEHRPNSEAAKRSIPIAGDLPHYSDLPHRAIAAAKNGDSNAFAQMFNQYRHRILRLARSYFARGAEHDDIIQEATIGFFKAVRDFKDDRGSFVGFADLCIRRQIITFIKGAKREKHQPLNYALSLDTPLFDDGADTLLDRLAAPVSSADFPDNEARAFLATLWSACSPLEQSVLAFYGRGYSYDEMAAEIGVPYKSIDNAVWRIKVKARKVLGKHQLRSA